MYGDRVGNIGHLVNTHDWIVKIALIVLLGVCASVLEWLICRRLLPRFIRTKHVWRRAFLEALHRPFQIFVLVIVASFILSICAHKIAFNGGFIESLAMSRRLLILCFVFWFGIRFIRHAENGITHRAKEGLSKINDETSVHAVSQVSRIILIAIVVLMMLQTVGVKMSALLAFGGVGGAIIGFAAKDSLANFIGGMMIYWDRPFSVGDWVRSPDREIEGTVENIGWRLTCIRTFDHRPLYVPNGILSNISVENPSRMWNRRIKLTVGVRYNDATKITELAKAIEKMLRAHPEIDTRRTTFVNLTDFGSFSLNILVYAFTKTTEWLKFQAIQQDVLLKILDIVAQHGAECAFPTQTINIPEGALLSAVTQQGENHEQYRSQ